MAEALPAAGRAGPPGPPSKVDGEPSQTRNGGPSDPALPVRKKLPHGVPEWVEDGAVYFITIACAVRGVNQLCSPSVADRVFEAVRFRQERLLWRVSLLVLMPDHLHALISFSRSEPMTKTVAGFKEISAKKTGIRWQRDFFEHRLRSNESYDEKVAYIRMNPVRKGLVARPEDWPFVWPIAGRDGPPGRPRSVSAVPAVPPYL